MRVVFVTVGDTRRRTGGYLYHAEVFRRLRCGDVDVVEIVAGDAVPAAQEAVAPELGARVAATAADVVVVDALARIACAPWLDGWRAVRPLVAMVHELPSVAALGGGAAARDRAWEEPLLRADRLIAVSSHGRAILADRGVPAGRIRVISPGFDRLPVPSAPATGVAGAPRPGDRPPRALCVAQWIPRKGIDVLVEAWRLLGRPEVTLELVGETDADGTYAATVRAAIAEALADGLRITVSEAVDDDALSAAYTGADVFVLPSRYEGYGMVYAEALAHGLPVVACAVGPMPDLIGPDAGILVRPDDPAVLATALASLLDDDVLRGRLSAGARLRAAQLPRWSDTARGFRAVLDDAVAARATAAL